MVLTLDDAEKVIHGALQKASDIGIAVTAVVVDELGHVIAVRRMDEARYLSVDLTIGKAFTAAGLKGETIRAVQSRYPFFSSAPLANGGMIVALPGGVPIRSEGRVIGAIAVGGGSGEEDVECAKAGIADAGFE
jgi:glc operon protein GlcG